MSDLKSPRWIVAKGLLFLGIAAFAGGLILLERPTWRLAILLGLLVWASARFYYFLFYVLEHYVDPTLRYAGIGALLQELLRRRRIKARRVSSTEDLN